MEEEESKRERDNREESEDERGWERERERESKVPNGAEASKGKPRRYLSATDRKRRGPRSVL